MPCCDSLTCRAAGAAQVQGVAGAFSMTPPAAHLAGEAVEG